MSATLCTNGLRTGCEKEGRDGLIEHEMLFDQSILVSLRHLVEGIVLALQAVRAQVSMGYQIPSTSIATNYSAWCVYYLSALTTKVL